MTRSAPCTILPPPLPPGASLSQSVAVCLERVLSHHWGWQHAVSRRPWGLASPGSMRAGIGVFGGPSVRDEPPTRGSGCRKSCGKNCHFADGLHRGRPPKGPSSVPEG